MGCEGPSSIPKPVLKDFVFKYDEVVPQANEEGCHEGWLPTVLSKQNKRRGNKLDRISAELSEETINSFSDQFKAQMEAKYELIKDERSRHLHSILDQLRSGLREPRTPYNLYLIEDTTYPGYVNAFAVLGGNIYMTTGMYELADSDDELALILGH